MIYAHFDFVLNDNNRILSNYPYAGILRSDDMDAERQLLFSAWLASIRKNDMYLLLLDGILSIIVSKFINASPAEITLFGTRGSAQVPFSSIQLFSPVIDYIHHNINRKISNVELANILLLSEKYFIKLFKKYFGITPHQYIKNLRIEYARSYLYQSKYTVSQIANMVGYSNAYSLSKAFKKAFNVPPTKFYER